MSVIADMIRAGIDPDIIARVHDEIVSAAKFHAVQERTSRQERNARYYQKKASEKRLNASNSDVSDTIKTEENASRDEYNTTRADALIPVGTLQVPPIEIINPNTSCLVKKQTRKAQLAEDAQPTAADREAAAERGLSGAEFREEWRAFRDFHCSHGNLMRNWHLAWCTWLRKRKKFQPRAGPPERDYGKGALAEMLAGLDERLADEPGRRAEGEISGGNVFRIPLIQGVETRACDDDDDVSSLSSRLPAGNR